MTTQWQRRSAPSHLTIQTFFSSWLGYPQTSSLSYSPNIGIPFWGSLVSEVSGYVVRCLPVQGAGIYHGLVTSGIIISYATPCLFSSSCLKVGTSCLGHVLNSDNVEQA